MDLEHDLRTQIVALLPRLRSFARGIAGSRHDGDDLLQAACEKALSRLHQFEVGTRLDRWIMQIVKTTHIDRIRQWQRQRPADLTAEIADVLPFDARIHEQTEARQDLSIVRAAFAQLPQEQREVMVLVVMEGMSYQDAADALDVPIGTVMSRLARARRKLMQAIESPDNLTKTGKDANHGPHH